MQECARKPAATYPMIVGSVIAQMRNHQQLRQEEVAQALGVTQATFSRMENGQSSITAEQLRAIGHRLGTQPSVLLSYAEDIERRLHNQGVEVTARRDDEQLKNAMILIGAAVVIGLAAVVIANAAKS